MLKFWESWGELPWQQNEQIFNKFCKTFAKLVSRKQIKPKEQDALVLICLKQACNSSKPECLLVLVN